MFRTSRYQVECTHLLWHERCKQGSEAVLIAYGEIPRSLIRLRGVFSERFRKGLTGSGGEHVWDE